MKGGKRRTLLVLLSAFLLLSCAACGGKNTAFSMRLIRTQGTVDVANSFGESVAPRTGLGLFSGYRVATQGSSYAWINLDDTKLAKMDERSEIEIQKEGKQLEIVVTSGGLFFNVTRPLAEDEELDIRMSTIMVGIRGTCGWVEVTDGAHMNVYLLEGTVEVTAGDNAAAVSAGKMAEVSVDGEIEIAAFSRGDIPGYVLEEIGADDSLAKRVRDACGIDVTGDPMDRFADVLAAIDADVLHTELVDFTGDGNRALVAFCHEQGSGGSTELSIRIYDDRNGRITPMDTYYISTDQGEEHRFALVSSSADDRLYLYERCAVALDADQVGYYEYYDTIITEEDQSYMWAVEQFVHIESGGNGYAYSQVIDGQDDEWREITAAEYAAARAKYSEIQVICYVENGEFVF